MRLLIIEDDAELAAAIEAGLRRRGLSCDHAATIGDGEEMLNAVRYAGIVLDLGLPDGDGNDLLRSLRARHNGIPILILSARGDIADRLKGLDAGADDYMIKPFDVDELAARLRAIFRRGSFEGQELKAGNLAYDLRTLELAIDGRAVGLSSRESELIELLLRRMGRVVTKRFVEDQLFGISDTFGSNAVEVYVHRLRRKLEQAGSTARIETIRGVGYLLRLPE